MENKGLLIPEKLFFCKLLTLVHEKKKIIFGVLKNPRNTPRTSVRGFLTLTGAILITLLLVVFISAGVDNKELKDSFKNCTKACESSKNAAYHDCISAHKNESKKLNQDFRTCIKDLRNAYRNNKANSIINKTEYKNKLRECNAKYLNGLKESYNKKECSKNDNINCEKKCKEEFCIQVYKPVCGADNKTYSSECELNKANVAKAYDGECRINQCSVNKDCQDLKKDCYWACSSETCIKINTFAKLKPYPDCSKYINLPNCGNGVCDNTVCPAEGCPPAENKNNCPKDCSDSIIDSNIKCFKDNDCGISTKSKYCSRNYSCLSKVNYLCTNPGTPKSICESVGSGGGCSYCANGCEDGNCVKDTTQTSVNEDRKFSASYEESENSCLKKGETGIYGKDKCCSGLKQEVMQTNALGSVVHIVCTNQQVNNQAGNIGKICTSNSECQSGYICIRYIEGVTNQYGGVYGTLKNPGKCIKL